MLVSLLCVFALAAAAPWLHRRLPAGWSGWALAVLPAALAVYFAAAPARIEAHEWVPALGVRLSFALDGLARLFALIVSGIGALVVVYAGAYLRGHERLGRLQAYLLAFMASMLGVVLADNVLALFVFWELTSVSSYLLIGFDQHRPAARAAALQALLVTGAGGLALLAGLLLLGQAGGSFELSVLAERGAAIRGHALYAPILLLVLLGAFTKSAQTPFHFWLPAAMEAPTPVSAYLHSATMVKAGIYLLARLSPALGDTALWHALVGGAGAVTMLAGAALALAQVDLKRLLAYSTVSALGVMTLLLGVGGPAAATAAIAFLVAHALYKGALFLVAGAVSHATGERDVTRLGGLRRAMPITAAAGALAALSMAGLPPFFGFVGKEAVLDVAWHAPALAWALTAALVVTSSLLVATALVAGVQPFAGRAAAATHAHEGPPAIWLGAAVLAAAGLAAGLAPDAIAGPLVTSAAASIAGGAAPAGLALWHGWTAPLGVGLLGLAAGWRLWRAAHVIRAARLRGAPFRAGPAGWYEAGFDGLNRLARAQTGRLQSGFLRRYLLLTIGATVALVGTALVLRGAPPAAGPWTDVRFHEAAMAAAVLASAAAAALVRSRLGAVAALGAVGFGIALLFALFGAPDLAMTQFVVEVLFVVLFVLVFYDLPSSAARSDGWTRLRDLAVAGAAGAMMTVLVIVATTVQLHPTVSGYFLERSVPDGHGRNVVNVILVDFRAIDTLGEISVLAMAAVGVYALVRLRPERVSP